MGGADPVAYLTKYKDRVKMVHMKEVKTVSPYEGTAIGMGLVDFPGIYKLLGDEVLYIVEQEGLPHMETWEGLRLSSEYLEVLLTAVGRAEYGPGCRIWGKTADEVIDAGGGLIPVYTAGLLEDLGCRAELIGRYV